MSAFQKIRAEILQFEHADRMLRDDGDERRA
jgi:hypothetical protein